MDLINNYISSNTRIFEGGFNWFLLVAILIVLLFSVVSFLIYWKKNKTFSIISSLILGLLFMGIMLAIVPTVSNTNWIDTTVKWLSWPGTIFLWSISIMIPIYLFVVIINFVLSDNVIKIKGKTYATSFFSLIGLSVFGVIVALLISPLILALPNDIFGIVSGVGEGEEEGSSIVKLFVDWRIILSMIALGLIFGFIMRSYSKTSPKDGEKIENFFRITLVIIRRYFAAVIIVVPLVIITRLGILGTNSFEETGNILIFMGAYLGFFWLGGLIIFAILFISNIFISNGKISKSDKAKVLLDQSLEVFASQSLQASLPITQSNVKKLGVCEEISELTPTMGTVMGMVMCNGFSPTLILIFIIANANGGNLDAAQLFTAVGIILLMTISTSGQGSMDFTIVLTALGALSLPIGQGENLYLSYIMPVHEINERTITKPNNSLGHALATQITEKVHRRTLEHKDK